MDSADLKQDLLFCRACGRHYRGGRRQCPHDGARLETVQPFQGSTGDVIDDRYTLKRRLGVGGMGTVWHAWDALSRREVALKVLNPRYASHAGSARRFLGEARMMRTVQHPGVVQLHRFGPTRDGLLLIDMEHVPGETVREHVVVRGRGMDLEAGMRVLDGALAALAACHSAGVVHCDIKPENVMLMGSGKVKLLDFGIAQKAGPIEQGEDFVILGTPAFMSPEQVRGASVDGRTDLYLLGCLAHELWTALPPFTSDDPLQLCQAQLFDEAPSLASRLPGVALPEGLEEWLGRLLAKDPDARPRSARAAREALRRIRRGTLNDLRPPSRQRLGRSRDALRGGVLPANAIYERGATASVKGGLVPSPQGYEGDVFADAPESPAAPSFGAERFSSAQAPVAHSGVFSVGEGGGVERSVRKKPAAIGLASSGRRDAARPGGIAMLRCLIEARQVFNGGTVYGPKAIEEILGHVASAFLADMKEMGAHVAGPDGALIELLVETGGDERGVICHLLDCLAELNARLERIPEPELEIRAAVRAVAPGTPMHALPPSTADLLGLLSIGPGSHVRVDEYVARWAGRRPIVRLGSVREAGGEALTTLYATSLLPA